jgi:hypothetical protein
MTKKPENIAVHPAHAHEDYSAMPANPLMEKITFTREELNWIRDVVIIGLQSFGELEKIFSIKEVMERSDAKWPEYLDVRHPTGDAETVAKFADVLKVLNC